MDGHKNQASTASVREINTTYMISAPSKCGNQDKFTLQKRKMENKASQEHAMLSGDNPENQPEKRLTLQRRTRMYRNTVNPSRCTGVSEVRCEPNSKTPRGTAILRSVSLKDPRFKSSAVEITRVKTPVNEAGKPFVQHKIVSCPLTETQDTQVSEGKAFSTPTGKTQFEKISLKKDMFEKLAGRVVPQPANQRQNKAGGGGEMAHRVAQGSVPSESKGSLVENKDRLVKPNIRAQLKRSADAVVLGDATTVSSNDHASFGVSLVPVKRNTVVNSLVPKRDPNPFPPVAAGGTVLSTTLRQKRESTELEDSTVTVAVRVRPFSNKENTENGHQVVFVSNQETVVEHPDFKQRYSFYFDFSFSSIDATQPGFACQQAVYEKLARPLLDKAFEGYNTCLFAYGQTGSGKSYTMMGYGEEAGVIPRFCEELFSRIGGSENNQITCHMEMSYFEVYNEKIHDLLVVKDEQSLKKLPLRVREHPVFGPYVSDLSTNVVSSYADIQGWLELGNKQRATAATGMNDKSSRSHSVFTLVMTQTRTEFVEEEEHDHRVISKINLVDLAGSERSSSAQTSGERLREGASINKSLLTLGKVICALSEQSQARRKVFIPYRESVLTWLLKESLGGNSKTAMIATISPSSCNVEETLSTLRYAKQARMIINIAKVNEDTNAKLIRELKAEVEKLKAAQMSSQGVEPEKIRLFQQEIATLKMQLSQQEKEMAEAHRTWKEKLEVAEKRKREETKELQKAGITFKMDNRLPNLVNLNEDPQLSEMLLYMIKEGQTKVGKLKSDAAHDIQLCGALIADEHCVISNEHGTVSIAPIKDAKTFVNGNLISKSTILHHGDRVILGGDHYFRFNHPVEVHSGKRVSCWTGTGDGQKDFEFAKNELLVSQQAQLEAEIEKARLKAKEEMMQGIQVAKEMAHKELSEQKMLYENKIKALEKELEEESKRKRCQELDKQRVVSQMEELQSAKVLLEQEVQINKKRLKMEAVATRQAMADHDVRHAKIIEALEAEKMRIAEDLQRIQKKQGRHKSHNAKHSKPQWDAMKLSLMIEEANTISRKMKKNTVFSRHESSDKENSGGEEALQIQVQNTKLSISTYWSLEKFQSNLAAMRELEQQGDSNAKDDDVFYDPNDEWEQDISATLPSSSFSRRRSRSLLKGRRISGRLYEIRVHPIQALNSSSSQNSGLMGASRPHPFKQNNLGTSLPAICKDLIGSALSQLCTGHESEESIADKLISDLISIHAATVNISDLFDRLDDDSQENLFCCDIEAQTQLMKSTSAIQRAVLLTTLWVSSIKPTSRYSFETGEKLQGEMKKMGGYFQLLIQGCDSDISSMVAEAKSKLAQCLNAALVVVGHLTAMTGMELHTSEVRMEAVTTLSISACLYEGACIGVDCLLHEGIAHAKEMQRLSQLLFPKSQVLQSLKAIALKVSSSIHHFMSSNISKRDSSLGNQSPADQSQLHSVIRAGSHLLQQSQAVKQLFSTLTETLTGKTNDANVRTRRDAICSASRTIDLCASGLLKEWGPVSTEAGILARDDLRASLQSLLGEFDQVITESSDDKTALNTVYSLPTVPSCSTTEIQWV